MSNKQERYLYIKSNRKPYDGFWGKNSYYSFEYGYMNEDGTREPVGKEADSLVINAKIMCDYPDKDTMRIWSASKRPIQWFGEESSTAWLQYDADEIIDTFSDSEEYKALEKAMETKEGREKLKEYWKNRGFNMEIGGEENEEN